MTGKNKTTLAAQHQRALQAFREARRRHAEWPVAPQVKQRFQALIRLNYRQADRNFPWRDAPSPYEVFVSEIMCQQTQAERVVAKYQEFLQAFPDFVSLANAPTQRLLATWTGLGYNRRALALKRSAQIIVSDFGGTLPDIEEQLRSLPGVGPYTCGALLAFAFQRPAVFIETNIRTVFLYFFFPGRTVVADAVLLPYIECCLDRRNPREWYYALMDYGAKLKREGVRLNHVNPAYRAQSKFRGSNRELRGKIVRVLSEQSSCTLFQLAKRLEVEPSSLKENLRRLENEGFLQMEKRRISVKAS